MANKLLLCYALLSSWGSLALGDESSESKETGADLNSQPAGNNGNTTPATTEKKADTKAIEKLILGAIFKMTTDPKEDDFEDFLKAMEFKTLDEYVIRNLPNVEIMFSKKSKNNYEMFITAGYIYGLKSFTLGEEFRDYLMDLRHYKNTITFEGNNKVVKDEKHVGFNCHNVFEFTMEGLNLNLECKGVKATLEFNRVKI